MLPFLFRYYPAGDLDARVAGGLSGEVVGVRVDNYRSAENFVNRKTVGEKGREGATAVAEKRREVACVVGVSTAVGIVVSVSVN